MSADQELNSAHNGLNITDNPFILSENLLNHVLLPRFIPNTSNIDFQVQESNLLIRVAESVKNLSKWLPPSTVRMMKSFELVQQIRTPDVITDEINKLQPGQTFAMYVRCQNTVFMCHMPAHRSNDSEPNETTPVIIATFPGRIGVKHIYSHALDLEVSYPVQALKVNFTELLRSPELAHQLSLLSDEKMNIDEDGTKVSNWLVASLADEDTSTASIDEFPVILKKIRDECIANNSGAVFFRRSALYNVLKVILHHNLTMNCGEKVGRFVYKLVMLDFMSNICRPMAEASSQMLNVDLMSQMIAKMARRMEKLYDAHTELAEKDEYEQFFAHILDKTKILIAQIRNKISQQIDKLQRKLAKNDKLLPLSGLSLAKDLEQSVKTLRKYMETRNFGCLPPNDENQLQINPVKRHYAKHQPPNETLFEGGGNMLAFLNDFEWHILYETEVKNVGSMHADQIKLFADKYASAASAAYTGDDKLGISRMILTRLKLLSMLDSIACKAFPMLLEHRPSINMLWFDELLLPQRNDMEEAHKLEQYFQNRQDKAKFPGLIESNKITEKSFSTRYARNTSEIWQLKAKMVSEANTKVEQKRREWERKRDKVAALRRHRDRLTCSVYKDKKGNTHHSSSCARSSLDRTINSVKICQYVYPLPEDQDEQHSIAFEFCIAKEIVYLRDALYEFNEILVNNKVSVNIKGDWENSDEVSKHHRPLTRTVKIGREITQQTKIYHVDQSFTTFIIRTASNCTLHANNCTFSPPIGKDRIISYCALSVDSSSPYANLQWTVHGSTHTQNQVLSNQISCAQTLSLTEYKNFGSLRADGCRLQWRKLFGMIECESLSFDQMSVVSLCLQAIWQQNPIGSYGSLRESHVDLQNDEFVMAMVTLLDKYVDQQRCNWFHPTKLLLAAFLVVRCVEVNKNDDIFRKCVQLLRKQREIAIEWCEKINEAIRTSSSPDQTAEMELRQKLVLVAIAGCATYFVHAKHKNFSEIFGKNDIAIWLQLIVTINNNLIITNVNPPMNVLMFLRLVQNIGINLEATITELVKRNKPIVIQFVRKQWAPANGSSVVLTQFAQNCPQTLVIVVAVNGNNSYVTIDIITGSFLVNNLPVARLPDGITSHDLFVRVFENFKFEVQPDGQHTFVSVQKYHGCSYEFKATPNKAVLITELYDDGLKIELIPANVLENEIPHLLCINYSHWWNKTTNCIEFRPKHFADENFKSNIEYKLDLTTARLIHVQTERQMIDVTSQSYRKIIEQLKRLECGKFIHIFIEIKSESNSCVYGVEPIAKIELVRMRLKFETSDAGNCYDLISNEFSGMRLSLKQNCGTLYGLHNGVVLEAVTHKLGDDVPTPSKILLLPHGSVRVQRSQNHVTVDIDVNAELRKPPFHRYQIDEFGRQIRSSNSSYSAWFYLAYLHAVTSHGEVEPLLGMSGTERSLQILQSAFVWSSAPYEFAALRILEDISNLTPVRKIESNIQRIAWPQLVAPRSAQDTFKFIVNRLYCDSVRLKGLFFGNENNTFANKKCSLDVNRRDYWRCRQLSPNTSITSAFIDNEVPQTSMPNPSYVKHSDNTRTIGILYHDKTFKVPQRGSVSSFLLTKGELNGLADSENIDNLINHTVYEAFSDLWIILYDAARHQTFNHEQFALIFSLLAHNGNDLNAILALQTIEANPELFSNISPPDIPKYYLNRGYFNASIITKTLRCSIEYPHDYYDKDSDEEDVWPKWKKQQYESNADRLIQTQRSYVEGRWPCREIESLPTNSEVKFNNLKAIHDINALLAPWYDNLQLKKFLEKVETRLQAIVNGAVLPQSLPDFLNYHTPTLKSLSKYQIDLNAKIYRNVEKHCDELDEAQSIWNGSKALNQRSLDDWWTIYQKIVRVEGTEHLMDSELYPRGVPSLVFPQIRMNSTAIQLKALIGVIGMCTVNEQRRKRIALYEHQTKLSAEHEHEPHTNWRPNEKPEWLLFEIEQDVCIRRIQVEVAKQMINPTEIGTKHSVMQLNMGEGKTAVIVPILAAYLANGQQVCQITVLKSLYATNAKSLRQCLGGMLNHKLYHFPCRRDMPIANYSGDLIRIYEECKVQKGVILTLPEYRCSFQLKMYESIKKGNTQAAIDFHSTHNWLQANVRHILDESDAILHAKYQLIYTVGNQLGVDGGELRWLVPQAVMKLVPNHMRRLYQKHGAEKIEFDDKYLKSHELYGADRIDYRSDVFTPCRLLDHTIFEELKTMLIEDFIEGRINFPFPEMSESTKRNARILLSFKQINTGTYDAILRGFSKQEQYSFMILSGLLRFDVLQLILIKRWRVNYGVNTTGPRKMAVPFKAKDVAAEMTEFGHPDVAICFTLMSYYYSGLTDDQLHHVFRLLHKMSNSNEIYEQWIASVPEKLREPSIQTYTGVNMSDPSQRDDLLFPVFRFNMHVIDFWLSQTVFPREAKSFEQKLMCSAWDLCSETFEHRVTGFSGTNDTKNLLPLPIRQNDLKELEDTNDKVRAVLLQNENQAYERLPENVSGKEILATLIDRYIPVLLDAGALMLELNNEQVARTWLELTSDIFYDAAVYFDDRDVLQTIDRNGVKAEFDCSVYREKLGRCLVYLDDTHTRGTDLKFPLKHRACVTLSGDITRDKTVQACMRMRKLGKGQSIAFFASFEADLRIREVCRLSGEDRATNEHVMEFITHNSRQFEVENMTHWSVAAVNYTKKMAGHRMHAAAGHELFGKCVDSEFVELKEMYGDKTDMLLSDIAKGKFSNLYQAYQPNDSKGDWKQFFDKMSTQVTTKIQEQAPDIRRFIHTLDDQQEKELEHELEQERQIERPGPATPHQPQLSQIVKNFLTNGDASLLTHADFQTMSLALNNTYLFQEHSNDPSAWSSHLYVTRDFMRVIENTRHADEYLRPVWWIAQTKAGNQHILLCLSSFECGRLMEVFEKSPISTLFMYRPRMSRFHSNLADIDGLKVTGKAKKGDIPVKDIAQIEMFAGSMYFGSEEEQIAYCAFMGLIPRPRTAELDLAFHNGQIQANGYVDVANRQLSSIEEYVGASKFTRNPVNVAAKIIEAHNQVMNAECHVASILMKGIKKPIEDESMDEN